MQIWDMPVPFKGTSEEAAKNFGTHKFVNEGGTSGVTSIADIRCINCDCRPSYVAAQYPCGVEPPRKLV